MIIALLVVLGLCFGSFVNALVWRLHEQERYTTILDELQIGKQTKAKLAKSATLRAKVADLSITKGRSMCTDCGHTLAWYDLLPLFSWLAVGGRCRYCHKLISWQYPVVELLTAAIFVFSYAYWPQALIGQGIFDFAVWLIASTAFMALSVYDFRWMILPNVIVYPLMAVAFIQRLIDTVFFGAGVKALLLSFAAALIGGGVFYVLYQLSDGNWIGGGDVKIGFALGLFVGTPYLALLLLMLASMLGIIGALPAIVFGRMKLKRNLQIPFGPCLMAACFILVLFGAPLVLWYSRLLLG